MVYETTMGDIEHLYTPFHPSLINNPYPFYELARCSAPVFYSKEIDHWVVSRYEDVKSAFLDHDNFSARNTLTPVTPLSEKAQQALKEGGWRMQRALGNQDRPEHTRFRKNIMRVFSARAVMNEEGYIRDLINELVDRIEGRGKGDLIEDILFQVPARVILKMLGFSEEEMPGLIEGGKNRNQYIFGKPSEDEQVQLARKVAELFRRCSDLVESRQQSPADDITTALINLQDEEGNVVFTEDEIASVLFAFFTAGHETTASLLGNAIRQLLNHRKEWDKICTDPSLIPNAVEEALRFDSSVVAWRRFATKEVMVGGKKIPKDAQLLLLLGAANRDEALFSEPECFDITRENAKKHLSFGRGVHTCFGNVLARLQSRVVLEVLTKRLPQLQLVKHQDFNYMPNLAFRTLCRLEVTW